MADPFIQQLDAISAPGTTAAKFLKKLGPLHNNWHLAHNSGTAQTGFLLFHWQLIKRFESVGGPAHFGGVTPFTKQQLASFHAAYNIQDVVNTGDVNSLEEFSNDLELWHNNAHMAVGMAFHINLMNPKTNVRLVQFWQLHYFINAQFEEKLADFRASSSVSIPSVVTQLEASNAAGLI